MRENDNEQNNIKKLRSLSPDANYVGNDAELYYQYLDEAINDDSMKNIAVTGSFGVGKSTILQSYNKNRNANMMFVSVLDLWLTGDAKCENVTPPQGSNNDKEGGEEVSSNTNKNSSDMQSLIEQNLLKQLLLRYSKKDLPASSFKFIPEEHKFKWVSTIPLAICAALVVLIICFITFTDKLFGTVTDFSDILSEAIVLYRTLTISLVLIVFISVYKLLSQFKVSKIAIKSEAAEGELERAEEENYNLDLNLSELVYIFEKLQEQKNHIIVFEDLDRFSPEICLTIFAKLRHLNVIVNNRVDMKHKKRLFNNKEHQYLKFIYVCKDDAFSEGVDICKFFDVLIPVVPSLGQYNVKSRIVNLWSDLGIDISFIEKISSYLIDYRMLINVRNEYNIFQEIYHSRKSANKMDFSFSPTECMAFVIYKNLFPEKYVSLTSFHKSGEETVFQKMLSDKTGKPSAQNEKLSEENNANTCEEILTTYMSPRTLRFLGYNREEIEVYYNSVLESEDTARIEKLLGEDSKGVYSKEDALVWNIYISKTNEKFEEWVSKKSEMFYEYLVKISWSIYIKEGGSNIKDILKLLPEMESKITEPVDASSFIDCTDEMKSKKVEFCDIIALEKAKYLHMVN